MVDPGSAAKVRYGWKAFIRTAAHQRQVCGINGLLPGTVTGDIFQRSAIAEADPQH
jgi:hypothetical protein